jgi:hypothetical protein
MGLVYSDTLKEWCEATLQFYQIDGIPVPRIIDNYCHRVLYGNAGNRKSLTHHRKNTNRKNTNRKNTNRKINRRIRRSSRRPNKKR